MNFNQNFFELFGLPARFAVDLASLESSFRELQREAHPDRHATASDAEKRLAVQMSARLNEGYAALRSPLARARYLLQLAGVDTALETNTAMPKDFLMRQMEWREALEEAQGSGDPARLDELEQRLARDRLEQYAAVESQLDQGEHAAAADTVRRLMFLEKLREDIGAAYESMDS